MKCSCKFERDKISISSVIGEDINELSIFDSEYENNDNYDSEEEKIIQYANSNEPLNYEEMPTTVCESKSSHFYYLISIYLQHTPQFF